MINCLPAKRMVRLLLFSLAGDPNLCKCLRNGLAWLWPHPVSQTGLFAGRRKGQGKCISEGNEITADAERRERVGTGSRTSESARSFCLRVTFSQPRINPSPATQLKR